MEDVVVSFFSFFTGKGWALTLGLMFMLVVTFLPGGLVEGFQRIGRKIMRKGPDTSNNEPAE